MAQIRQYQAEGLGLRPTEAGVEAQAATGRRIGGFYNQTAANLDATGARLGSAVKVAGDAALNYQTQRDISHGALALASTHAGLTQDWNEMAKNADPNDPSIAGRFQEEVLSPKLDKFQEAFSTEEGRKWAEHHVATSRALL